MGKILSKIFGNKEMRILMLGLDAAGKTSESYVLCLMSYISYSQLNVSFVTSCNAITSY